MKTRFYYTLAETMRLTDDETEFAAINQPYFMELIEESSVQVGGLGFYINTILDKNLITDDLYSKTVMRKYIWPLFYNEKVMYIDVEHAKYEAATKPLITSTEFANARKEYAGKVWSWIEESKFRYSKLVELYSAQLSNLFNQIKTTNVSKFNDTPQANISGGFAGDNYTSTITNSESGTDGGSVIARLEEIRQLLHNTYAEWAKEFSAFTIEE